MPLLLTMTVPLMVKVPTRGASLGIVLEGALAARALNASKVLPSFGLDCVSDGIDRLRDGGTYALTLPTIPTWQWVPAV